MQAQADEEAQTVHEESGTRSLLQEFQETGGPGDGQEEEEARKVDVQESEDEEIKKMEVGGQEEEEELEAEDKAEEEGDGLDGEEGGEEDDEAVAGEEGLQDVEGKADTEGEGVGDPTDGSQIDAAKLPKRPMSGYFIFLGEHRGKIMAENGGSVAAAGKILGEKWKALSAEDKKVFEEKAEQAKIQYDKQLKEMGLTPEMVKKMQKKKGGDSKLHLPVARIKRLVNKDPEVHRTSAEATTLITAATESFIGYLCSRALGRAALRKRKGIRVNELYDAIHSISQLQFLRGPMKSFFDAQHVGGLHNLKSPKKGLLKKRRNKDKDADSTEAGESSTHAEGKSKRRKLDIVPETNAGQRSVADMFGAK
eukprot:gb/GEZN01007803.1/.p1 GENE.gb/GEZN01007803.1/~~gb/GEZN01007803.1/.p1  ORF type:complete len:366 (-),score=110.22 gb/GEZN01007803.1/:355-1452(-)